MDGPNDCELRDPAAAPHHGRVRFFNCCGGLLHGSSASNLNTSIVVTHPIEAAPY